MYNAQKNFYNFLRKCYRTFKQILRKQFTKQLIALKCNFKWFGNEYGGFFICNEILKDEIIVYSAGVGEDISFDIDLINEYPNCKIFAFDPTPKSIEWVKKQNLPENFKFFPYGISKKTGEEVMFLPKNKNHVSGSIYESSHLSEEEKIVVQMKCLEDIVKENNHDYIDIIKMDIEGSEFSVIKNLNFRKINCGSIVVEFHNSFFEKGSELMNETINILRQNNFYCFAISNSGEEYSFINKGIHNKYKIRCNCT
jgi:FkbM family methyltransferase